jgi:hypothetical protein
MTRFSTTEVVRILAQDGYSEIKEADTPRPEPPPAKEMREKLERKAKHNKLAAEFERVWRSLDGPDLIHEYRFHPSRKWRADYAHPRSMTMIELDGGIWLEKGGHQGKGKLRDNEKQNSGNLLGWTTFRLSPGQIDIEHIGPIAGYVRENTP